MPASKSVTETIILHLKEGVNLENMACDTGASTSTAVQVFIQLIDTVKSQQGFIRQFWVTRSLLGYYDAWTITKHRVIKSKISESLSGLLVNSTSK